MSKKWNKKVNEESCADSNFNIEADLEIKTDSAEIISTSISTSTSVPAPELEKVEYETKVCKIIGFSNNAIHINFNDFGIVVKTKNLLQYQGRGNIRVAYIGEIGNPDFRVWVD